VEELLEADPLEEEVPTVEEVSWLEADVFSEVFPEESLEESGAVVVEVVGKEVPLEVEEGTDSWLDRLKTSGFPQAAKTKIHEMAAPSAIL